MYYENTLYTVADVATLQHLLHAELIGIMLKQVYAKYLADTEELLGVDRWLVEEALYGTAVHAHLVGKSLVSMALPMQLVADNIPYMYLHDDCYLCAILPIPLFYSDDHRQKEGEQISSPNCGRGIPLQGKTQMPAYWRTFAFVALEPLMKFPRFS